MKYTINFLLFTILFCAAPAMQAMGMLQAIGKFKLGRYVAYAQKKDIAYYTEKNIRRLDALLSCKVIEECFINEGLKTPSREMGKKLLPLFESLKMKFGNINDVALASGDFSAQLGMMMSCQECDHKLVIVDHNLCNNLNAASQQFIIAHELAHASKDHVKELHAFQNQTAGEMETLLHEQEHEADAEAARVLGTITSAVEFFTNWIEAEASSQTHPSNKKRIEKLLALQIK